MGKPYWMNDDQYDAVSGKDTADVHADCKKRVATLEERVRSMAWVAGPAADGNEPGEIEAGDRFLILVAVRCRHDPKGVYWESSVIVASEDGWDDADGESWGAWSWDDVSWWIQLDKHNLPPLPTSEVTRKDG